MKSNTLFAALLSIPAIVSAGVNPKNGNFFISYHDIKLESGGHELILGRTYNSRASDIGWFGAGWGSFFETRLVAMPDDSVAIKENGSGKINYYRPKLKTKIEESVTPIVEAAIRQDNLSVEDAAALRKKLAGDENLRVRKVLQYGLDTYLSTETTLQSDECSAAKLVRVAGGYHRSGCDRSLDYFNIQGRLVRHQEADGYAISADYAYEDKNPSNIADTLGQHIQLQWNTDGLLAAASAGEQGRVYSYDKDKNLLKTTDSANPDYHYEYDDKHNMTGIVYIDTTSMRIAYLSPENGTVKSVTERTGEKTLYEYRTDPADPNHIWTMVTAVMPDGQRSPREYEYRLQTTDTGNERVASLGTSDGNKRTDTVFDDKGRIVRKANDAGDTVEYTYDPSCGKIATVTEKDLKTRFRYDRKNNLIRAENSKGQVIKMDYGKTEQIQRMTEINPAEHARRVLTFKYNEAGRPTEIRLQGTGKINVEYDDQGEISKVQSDQGVKMAIQVTQAFQNLLRVVQVAGVRTGM